MGKVLLLFIMGGFDVYLRIIGFYIVGFVELLKIFENMWDIF